MWSTLAWPPRHCLYFWTPCLFSILFCLNQKHWSVSRKERNGHDGAVGALLLQIQMFIRSAKHRYKVSWKGEGGRHAASSEVNCTAELFMSCKLPFWKASFSYATSKIILHKIVYLSESGAIVKPRTQFVTSCVFQFWQLISIYITSWNKTACTCCDLVVNKSG